MPRPFRFALGLFLIGCGHDVPEHDVVVESDCSGTVESARFRFEAMDFETTCSGGGEGFLSATCTTNHGLGRRVSGTLDVHTLVLEGFEDFGPSRYVLEVSRPGEEPTDAFDGTIRCEWFVNESLELTSNARQACDFARTPCTAKLTIIP